MMRQNDTFGRSCLAASAVLMVSWMLMGAGCEPPLTTSYQMGYPYSVDVKADGIDTIVTGAVIFSNFGITERKNGEIKHAKGLKNSDGKSEIATYEWVCVESAYSEHKLRIVVDTNKTSEARKVEVMSNQVPNFISIYVCQEAGSK